MKKCVILVILLLIYLSGYGQNAGGVKVSGQLTDSTGAAVQDANIVFGGKGSSRTTYAVSDANGAFSVTLPAGKYSIGITHISYKDIVEALNITADTTLSYRLTANSNKLSEVKVYGDFIKRKGTGFTAKVRGNPLAEDRSVLSFMNMLPGIRGLSVNGREAAVYINGRELRMESDELLRYLSSIPTESIDEVSARASKSAGMRASGQESSIYISLRKVSDPRYSGKVSAEPSLGLRSGRLAMSTGGSVGYFEKKFSSFSYLRFNNFNDKSFSENNFEGKKEHIESRRIDYSFAFDQSFFYDIDSSNSIGLGAYLFFKPDERTDTRYYGDASSAFGKEMSEHMNKQDLFVNYRHLFGKKKSEFNFKADILSDVYRFEEDYEGLPNAITTPHKDMYLNYGVKANVLLELTDKAELDAGIDYISANSKRKYYVPLSENIERFKFNEGTIGMYAEFSAPLSVLEFSLGVRYEHDFYKMTDVNNPSGHKKTWYNDLFPTASVSYNAKKYSASIYFSRSAYRYSMYNYAPSVTMSGEFIINERGAFPIRPTYRTSVSIVQTFRNMFNCNLLYQKRKEGASQIFIKEGDYLISTTTAGGSQQDYTASLSSKIWIVKRKFYANLYFTGKYSDISRANESDYSWSANGSISMTYKLPKSWEIGASGRYSTPSRSVAIKSTASWNCGIRAYKKFNSNWSMSLYGSYLLNNGKVKFTTTTPGIDYVRKYDANWPSLEVSIVYKFNNFRGKKASNIGQIRMKGSN